MGGMHIFFACAVCGNGVMGFFLISARGNVVGGGGGLAGLPSYGIVFQV